MTIGLDIDGVVANFYAAYEKRIKEVTGRDLFPATKVGSERFPQEWNWPQAAGYTGEEINRVWEDIKNDPHFWLSCQQLDSTAFLHSLPQHAITYFITDRPGVNVQGQSAEWLKAHGVNFPNVIITQGRSKGPICKHLSVDVMIDDKWENVLSVMQSSPKTKAVLLARPYNAAGWTRTNHLVHSLEEFQEKYL